MDLWFESTGFSLYSYDTSELLNHDMSGWNVCALRCVEKREAERLTSQTSAEGLAVSSQSESVATRG